MYCVYCGSILPDDALFCNKCGRQQQPATSPPTTNITLLANPASSPGLPSGVGEVSDGNMPMVLGTPSVPGSTGAPASAGTSLPLTPSAPQSEPHLPHNSPVSHHGAASGLKGSGHLSRRALLLGIAGATTALIAGGGITWLIRSQKPPEPTKPPIGTILYTYHGHSGYVYAIAWSPNGKYIASTGTDNTVRVWNATDGSQVWAHHGIYYARAVAWSPDGKRIVSSVGDTIQVWNATDGGQVSTYQGSSGYLNAVAWSPDGKYIASAGTAYLGNTIQVWNATNGGQVFTCYGHSELVNAVAWSPNGRRIASGSYDKTVREWNAADGSQVFIYYQQDDQHNDVDVIAAAWSPDRQRIVSAGGQTIQVWNASDGSKVWTYDAPIGSKIGIGAVVWSPDGKYIASAGDTVRVWNATDGRLTFTYHTNNVNAVAWSPDGQKIATVGTSKTVQVWQAS